ncbi:peroxisomal leader peptide-processing protease [Thrips palmi]|uniref:Peroxisomal leader peptide-processing protease n=1 Tax=Thrips palmi TaxID=161013 RepID=A0A6P8ZD64_THRPL|nr:peroxisomal leader peptide-processing protease [Thrips palmi]
MWGSGVVVDKEKRVVLTCAHVLAEDEPVSVFWGGHSVKASVLWRSADGVPYDVAVLQLADDACVAELEALALDTRPPRVGEPVLAVGYPLFSERCAVPAEALSEHRVVRPLVSRGEVSGWWRSSSSQILSTCCVQSGASGGPLLRLGPTGPTAIGVLVCNAQLGCGRDAVVYPHVNFALWADTVAGPINEFLASGDAAVLAGLQCDSPSVQRQWKLQPPKMCKL